MGNLKGQRPIQILILLLLLPHIHSITVGSSISLNNEESYITSNGPNTSNIELSWFNTNTRDMAVDIYFVGTDSSDDGEIVKSEWDTYDLNSDQPLTAINLQFNVTGLTSWDLGLQKFPGITNEINLGHESKTIGNIYALVDNSIEQMTHYALEGWGYTVAVPKGDHIITVLYVNYDAQNGVVYASQTITVRIRDIGMKINPHNIAIYPLNNTITELYESSLFTEEIIYETEFRDAPFFIYRMNDSKIVPTIDTRFTLNNASHSNFTPDELILLSEDKEDYVFNLNGVVNTTGFTGLQLMGSWDTEPGITFLLDANGIHDINTVENINIRNASLNQIAMISLAPYGFWHSEIPCPDDSECTGPTGVIDWEININFAPSTGWGDVNIDTDSSFDFVQTIQTFSFNYIEFAEAPNQSKEDDSSSTSFIIIIAALVALPIIKRRRIVI